VQFADAMAFQPAFLYESLWDLLACLILLWVARRFAEQLKSGDIFLLYVVLYASGHFLVETLRIHQVFLIWGSVSGELLLSGALAVGFALLLLFRHPPSSRRRPAPD